MRPVRPASLCAAVLTLVLACTAALHARALAGPPGGARWTEAERATLRALALTSLGPLPPDPSNRVADDPRAAALGHRLFFDPRLSGNGRVSCASCHAPDRQFQDDRPLAEGVGMAARRTMPVAGTAHGPWQFWDGRADSQWAQALGPLESAVEHGTTRTQVAHAVAEHHRADYEALFGPLPPLEGAPPQAGPVADSAWRAAWTRLPAARQDAISGVYANVGKAIAAYERRLGFAPSRFDRYVAAELGRGPRTPESTLSADEVAGLRLFIGRASCVNCHNGPRLTDDHFHNTGVPRPTTALPEDSGRAAGVRQALAGEFNCLGRHSDAPRDGCDELRFAATEGEALVRAYKTPSLRGVAERAPYMHAGQLATLREVVAHYDRAPRAPAGHSELRPLSLTAAERAQLEAFLRTLASPVDGPAAFLRAPAVVPLARTAAPR